MVKKYGVVGAFLDLRIIAIIAEQDVFNLCVATFHHTMGRDKGILPRSEFFAYVFPMFCFGFIELDRRTVDRFRHFALALIFTLEYGTRKRGFYLIGFGSFPITDACDFFLLFELCFRLDVVDQ